MKKTHFLFISSFLCATITFAQAPVMNSITGPSSACSSPALPNTYNATASNSPTAYAWSVSPSTGVVIANPTAANTTISFPHSNGTYTIYCSASNNFGSSAPVTYTVNVFETPTVTFSGANTFCQGSSTNIQASSTILAASPTIFYNWTPPTGLNTTSGPNVVASPQNITTYTVTGTIGFCSNSSQITITPKISPTVTLNSYNVDLCAGSSTTLTASGANTYAWTGGITNGVGFTPSFSNFYIVTGTDLNGCTDTSGASVNVYSYPALFAAASPSAICAGNSTTLNFSGASSYSINSFPTANNSVQSPSAPTTYTISGANFIGCTSTTTLSVFVSSCVGITENSFAENDILLYPNPSTGTFNIKAAADETALIINELGQVIRNIQLKAGSEEQVSGLNSGIYFMVTPHSRNRIVVIK